MNASNLQLHALATANGVHASYFDVDGTRQSADPDVLAAVLQAMGVSAGSERQIRDSLRATAARLRQQCLEPVTVTWDKRPARIELRLPPGHSRTLKCQVHLETGESLDLSPRGARKSAATRSSAGDITRLTLPSLPMGYHTIEAIIDDSTHRSVLICAPAQSYTEPATRSWGAFLPLYAAHSQSSWGAGNFSDYARVCEWLGSFGQSVAATLPLLATFLDWPVCEPTPYSPASRLFWNEFYLDIPQVPEFGTCAPAQKLAGSHEFQNHLRAFRKSPMIDYRTQWAARRKILELLAKHFFEKASPRHAQFKQFLRARPEVEQYSRFRATCDRSQTSWRNWPARLRKGSLQPTDYDEGQQQFHLYVQWLAQEQFTQLIDRTRAAGVKLYLDLPLGVSPDGYDIWRERDSYVLDAAVGAPPDTFFPKGQDWGFSPLHPQRIREQGYRHFRDYLAFQMRHTSLLRIDHVMGLHRLYWVPKGFPAHRGAYVSYQAEEFQAVLNLESHRDKTVLIGENLGTVPPEVNESMRRHHLREMFVVQYEQRPDPKRALRLPPAQSVASLNTHDMPTFAAHWEGLDITDRHELGLIRTTEVATARRARRQANAALVRYLSRQGAWPDRREPGARAALIACLRWLASSPAGLVLVNLEDLWLEQLPQNVPGTSTERPNWRRKARLSLEDLEQNPDVLEVLKQLSALRRTGRKL